MEYWPRGSKNNCDVCLKNGRTFGTVRQQNGDVQLCCHRCYSNKQDEIESEYIKCEQCGIISNGFYELAYKKLPKISCEKNNLSV